MPLPKPSEDQSKDEFIGACMANSIMNKEYSNNKQRYAICNRLYDQSKEKKSKGKVDKIDFTQNYEGQDVILL